MRSALLTGMNLTVILLLLLAFNLVWVNKIPDIRWDYTAQKTHTLSSSVRPLLASLDSPIDLYYFNAINDPKRSYALQRYGKHVEDLLKEYEKASKGMINLHIIEPAPFSEDSYKASLFGLDDEHGFLGLIGTRAGQGAQRIQSFSPEREPLLEYEISHLIYKLQHPERPIIGLLSGLALKESGSRLLKTLQQHFNLVTLESTAERIPEHVEALMVVHPRALSESTLYGVEQFVLKGGKLLMFIDPLSEQSANTPPANSRLDDLLAAWGVQMTADKFLVDPRYASWATPGAKDSAMQYPARLNLPREAMNTHDVSSWNLAAVTVSSSGALSRLNKSRTTFIPLLQSSEQSELLNNARFVGLSALDALDDKAPIQGKSPVIAARIEGPGYSTFPDGMKGQPPGLQKAAQIHAVVVADTDVLSDSLSGPGPDGNSLFILNTLDNLSAADALASIRPRAKLEGPPTLLERMRQAAQQSYRVKASELERRLLRTEMEWQQLNPAITPLGTQTVDPTTQLQALNKERLRLPMELHALQTEAYARVNRLELALKLAVTFAIPLALCLMAWLIFLGHRRRRLLAARLVH
ncbi:Gldg family protein [Pseudomonas graminis]